MVAGHHVTKLNSRLVLHRATPRPNTIPEQALILGGRRLRILFLVFLDTRHRLGHPRSVEAKMIPDDFHHTLRKC